MNHDISLFGGGTRVSVRIGDGIGESIEIDREIWFDRDIDGRWLVWVQDREQSAEPLDNSDDGPTGAIVVQNRDVRTFIEQLARLLVDPAEFEHEPVFRGADDEPEGTAR